MWPRQSGICTWAKGSVVWRQRRPCETHTCLCPPPLPMQKMRGHLPRLVVVTILGPFLGPVHTRLKGMPYFFRMMGEISVILCLRKASQPCELPGKKPGVKESSVRVGASVGNSGCWPRPGEWTELGPQSWAQWSELQHVAAQKCGRQKQLPLV